MGRIIALVNQKGGVGKSTTAVNLGAALAVAGRRVLVVDTDPQGNTTTGLGVEKARLTHDIYHVLMQEIPLERAVVQTEIENLPLVPGDDQSRWRRRRTRRRAFARDALAPRACADCGRLRFRAPRSPAVAWLADDQCAHGGGRLHHSGTSRVLCPRRARAAYRGDLARSRRAQSDVARQRRARHDVRRAYAISARSHPRAREILSAADFQDADPAQRAAFRSAFVRQAGDPLRPKKPWGASLSRARARNARARRDNRHERAEAGFGPRLGERCSARAAVPVSTSHEVVREIPVTEITPNPFQPRKSFDAAALDELKTSIAEYGVLVPIIVRRRDDRLRADRRRTAMACLRGSLASDDSSHRSRQRRSPDARVCHRRKPAARESQSARRGRGLSIPRRRVRAHARGTRAAARQEPARRRQYAAAAWTCPMRSK